MLGILDIVPILTDLIDKVIPDPQAREQFQLQLAQLADKEADRESAEVLAQDQTNTAEASNPNLFVAGWRPAIGWVGATALAYSFILEPFMEYVARIEHYTGSFPTLDISNLMTLMMGMLGFGYLRTKEKINGIPDSQPDVGVPQPAATPAAPQAAPAPQKKVLGIPWPF